VSLPPSLITFLRAYDALSESCVSYAWGTVTRNRSLSHIHDANRAWVYDVASPSLEELKRATAKAQAAVAVAFTQVEVLDIDARAPLFDALTGWLGPPSDLFSFMTTAAASNAVAPPGIRIGEQPFPDRRRWRELIDAGHSDEDPLPEDVLEEFARRDTEVLVPAGVRFFTAEQDGEVAAYTSMLSLGGVGLIDNVATLPEHRRRGLGTAVVGAALAASHEGGNRTTCLFTQQGSEAQRIYERLGMRVIARAAQFHSEPPADASHAQM
jgi:ribosomal protein S18 acetylase RimI-like enzyme